MSLRGLRMPFVPQSHEYFIYFAVSSDSSTESPNDTDSKPIIYITNNQQ